ncbi:sigma-70 family RNA polymerase sigma factor [Nakamurella lactea]|uniref:sigma-70 family RNA polymerase sigma factor n=1 Tax=Nakamurella lactea TaxID=459515 RepID=UPI0006875193|nr:sigma-70 family RNA polymerase sigma factor [Nakamurella lactea]
MSANDRSRRSAPDYEAYVAEQARDLGGLAAALCGAGQDAEELLADALVEIWRKWHLVTKADSQVAYGRRIMTTTYLAAVRRDRRRRSLEARLRAQQEINSPPTDRTETLAHHDQLDRALDSIPAKERAALVLRYYLDQPTESIAKILGCTSAAARTYQSRGRARLAAALTESEGSSR